MMMELPNGAYALFFFSSASIATLEIIEIVDLKLFFFIFRYHHHHHHRIFNSLTHTYTNADK